MYIYISIYIYVHIYIYTYMLQAKLIAQMEKEEGATDEVAPTTCMHICSTPTQIHQIRAHTVGPFSRNALAHNANILDTNTHTHNNHIHKYAHTPTYIHTHVHTDTHAHIYT